MTDLAPLDDPDQAREVVKQAIDVIAWWTSVGEVLQENDLAEETRVFIEDHRAYIEWLVKNGIEHLTHDIQAAFNEGFDFAEWWRNEERGRYYQTHHINQTTMDIQPAGLSIVKRNKLEES